MFILLHNAQGIASTEDEKYFKRVQDPLDPTEVATGSLPRTTENVAEDQVIVTGFRPSKIEICSSVDADNKTGSRGECAGAVQFCIANHAGVVDLSQTKTIIATSNGNGWEGTVTLNQNGFTIAWTKVGQGLTITSSYIAIK